MSKQRKDTSKSGEGDIPVCKFTTHLNAAFVESFKNKLETKIMKDLPILGNFLTMGQYLEVECLPTLTKKGLRKALFQDQKVSDEELDVAYSTYLSKQIASKTKRMEDEMDAKRSAYAIILEHLSLESRTHMAQDPEYLDLQRKTNDPLLLWNIFIRTHTTAGSNLPEVRCHEATVGLYQVTMNSGESLASFHTRFMAALRRLDEFTKFSYQQCCSMNDEWFITRTHRMDLWQYYLHLQMVNNKLFLLLMMNQRSLQMILKRKSGPNEDAKHLYRSQKEPQ